jgi:hypothetical protein
MSVTAPVLYWLRAEGLAVFALSLLAYWHTGTSWWLFFALLLVPDIAMLPYLLNPRAGAVAYNLAHNYVFPLSLAAVAMLLRLEHLLPYLLIWTAHIGMDRMLGYGLKYPSGFKVTHLGALNSNA